MKSFIKLTGIAVGAMLFSGLAFGQTVTCVVNNTAQILRAEGVNELIPGAGPQALTLSCTNTAGATTGVFTFTPSAPVTSAITASATSTTEVLAVSSAGGGLFAATLSGNTLSFGTAASPIPFAAIGTTTQITIANLRLNASAVAAAGAVSAAGQVQVVVAGVAGATTAIASAQIALVQNGLAASLISGDAAGTAAVNKVTFAAAAAASYTNSLGVCNSTNNSNPATGANFFIRVTEGFYNAFRTLANEGSGIGAEAPGGTVAINSGTRIKITISNVPTGMSVYLPLTVNNISGGVLNAQAQLQLTETAATGIVSANVATAATTPTQFTAANFPVIASAPYINGVSGLAPAGNAGGALITPSNGTAVAIYEITAASISLTPDSLLIPVFLQNAANVLPAQSTQLAVSVSFGPITSATTFPAFVVGPTTTTQGLVNFTQCTTTLLFPFVSNAAGFETGIAISNTSVATIPSTFANTGTKVAAQQGTCSLGFYGTGGTNPASVQAPNPNEGGTAAYASGEAYAFTLTQALAVNSANPATFTGFIIAQCNFQYAHGFGYIVYGGLGTPNAAAMGYLAEVIGRGTNGVETVTF